MKNKNGQCYCGTKQEELNMNKGQEQFFNRLADLFNEYEIDEIEIVENQICFRSRDFDVAFEKYMEGTFFNCNGSCAFYDTQEE